MKKSEWCAEHCLNEWLMRVSNCKPQQSYTLTSINKEDITIELLEECYVIMAHIVTEYGAVYLPIFERLQNEIGTRKTQHVLLTKAFQISVDNSR